MATWKSVCCAAQGKGHLKTGTPCQDKVFQQFRNGTYAVALADGAGSALFSHFGAECIVHQICDYLTGHFEELFSQEDGRQVKRELLEKMKSALEGVATEHECKVSDLASTVLAVAVHADCYIIAHIGDGVIGYLKEHNLKVASAPDNGEFSNVTTFVTSSEALASMRLFKGKLNNISAFVLMSDGTEQSLYHKPTKSLGGAVIKLMQKTCLLDSAVMEKRLENTLTSVVMRNTQDDCSIAILARPLDALRSLEELTSAERQELFQISSADRYAKLRLRQYDEIIKILKRPRTLQQIARKIRLRFRHTEKPSNTLSTRKHLETLLEVGVIVKTGSLYSCV